MTRDEIRAYRAIVMDPATVQTVLGTAQMKRILDHIDRLTYDLSRYERILERAVGIVYRAVNSRRQDKQALRMWLKEYEEGWKNRPRLQ